MYDTNKTGNGEKGEAATFLRNLIFENIMVLDVWVLFKLKVKANSQCLKTLLFIKHELNAILE